MQEVYRKATEVSHTLATLFEANPEVMTLLVNIVVEAKIMLKAFIDVVE